MQNKHLKKINQIMKYRLYKSGKLWIVATVSTAIFGVSQVATTAVHADTTNNNNYSSSYVTQQSVANQSLTSSVDPYQSATSSANVTTTSQSSVSTSVSSTDSNVATDHSMNPSINVSQTSNETASSNVTTSLVDHVNTTSADRTVDSTSTMTSSNVSSSSTNIDNLNSKLNLSDGKSSTSSNTNNTSVNSQTGINVSSTSQSSIADLGAQLDLRVGSEGSTVANWGTATLTIDDSGNALLANGEFKSTNRPSDAILESIRNLTFSNATYNDSYAAGLFAASNSMSLYDSASSVNPFGSLQSIDFTGTSGWDRVTNFANMFAHDDALQSITFDHDFTTKNAVDVSGMFDHNVSLETLDLSQGDFNTGNVTHMQNMFNNNYTLQSLNLGDQFDTSNVTQMYNMFQNDYVLNPLSLGDKFDTSKVVDMASMFNDTHALVNLDLGDKFDTSNVKNMDSMFNGMTKLTALNLGQHFNTKNVTDMNAMFGSGNSLTKLDLGTQFDTSNVTSMQSMFGGLSSIKTLDLSHTNFDTSKVTNMGGMFYGLGAVTNLNLGTHFNTSQVTDFSSMFGQNYNLRRLNLGNEFDTSNAKTVAEMFNNTGLAYINFGDHFKLNSNVDQNGFYGPFDWMVGHTIFNFGKSDTTFNSNANMSSPTYQGNYNGKNYTVNGSNNNGLVFPAQTNGSLLPMMDWKSSAASYRDHTNQTSADIDQISQAFNVAGLTSAMSSQYRSEIDSAKAVAFNNASLNQASYNNVAANQSAMDNVWSAASQTASGFHQANLNLIVAIDANDNSGADTDQSLLNSYGNALASQLAIANSNAQGISDLGSQTTDLLNTMNRNSDLTLAAYNDIAHLSQKAVQAVADSQAQSNLGSLAQLANLVPSYHDQIQSSAQSANSYNNDIIDKFNQASSTVDSIQDLASSMSQNSDLATLSSLMGDQFNSLFAASQDAGEGMSIADSATASIGSYVIDASQQSSLLSSLVASGQTAINNHDSTAYSSLANAASVANANLNNDNYQASYLNDSMSVALNGISFDFSNNPQMGLISDDQQTSLAASVASSAAITATNISNSAQHLNQIANSLASSATNILQSSNATISSTNQRHADEQTASQAIDQLMQQNTDLVNSAAKVVNDHVEFSSLAKILNSLKAEYQSLQALQTTVTNTASNVAQQNSSANTNNDSITAALNGMVFNAQSMGSRALVGNLSSASTLLNQVVGSQTDYNNFSNAVDQNVSDLNQNGNQFDQASAAMHTLKADFDLNRSNFDQAFASALSSAESAAKSKADSEASSAAKSKADSEAASAAKSKADSEAASAAKSKADSEAASAAKSKADSEAASAAKSKADSEAASVAKSQSDSEAASVAKSKADSEAASAAKSKADSEAASAAKSKADSEASNISESSAAKSRADSIAASESASASAKSAAEHSFAIPATSNNSSHNSFNFTSAGIDSVAVQLPPVVVNPIPELSAINMPTSVFESAFVASSNVPSAFIKHHLASVQSTSWSSQGSSVSAGSLTTSATVQSAHAKVDRNLASSNKLPQTGEENTSTFWTWLGLILLTLSGVLVGGFKKRRHPDDDSDGHDHQSK